jgi:hypothetical protein
LVEVPPATYLKFDVFCESTCSGVSEISNLFLVHELLG